MVQRLFELPTQEIRVGDLVNVLDGEAFPCDMVLLTSSSTDGNCTITTTNLDGETALKTRAAPTATRHLVLSEFDEVDVTVRPGLLLYLISNAATTLRCPPSAPACRPHGVGHSLLAFGSIGLP